LRQEPECRARQAPFRTNIALAIALGEEARRGQGPLGVVGFEAWSLAEDVVRVLARRRKAGSGLLHKNRRLETSSLQLRDAHGWPLKRPGPYLAVADLGPLIPVQAYRPVNASEQPSWGFTLTVRLPSLGKVRSVVSCEPEWLTGRPGILVTNRVDWSAAKSISLYVHRRPTATFDQDRNGPLGCNAERMRRAEAMGNQWCLVFVADALVHWPCLPVGPERTQGLIHPMGDACRQHGHARLQKLLLCVHAQFSQGATADQVFVQLCAKQRGKELV